MTVKVAGTTILSFRQLQRSTVQVLKDQLPILVTVNDEVIFKMDSPSDSRSDTKPLSELEMIMKKIPICNFCKSPAIGRYDVIAMDSELGDTNRVQKDLCQDHLTESKRQGQYREEVETYEH